MTAKYIQSDMSLLFSFGKRAVAVFQFRLVLSLFCLLLSFALSGQTKGVSVRFMPFMGNEPLTKDSAYVVKAYSDTVRVDGFRFYVSHIQFLIKGKVISESDSKGNLIDLFDSTKCTVFCPIASGLTFDHIRFNLGIDSATNVSGVLGGDLDPTRGMYWTWQSGYINMKLEGVSSRCNERNNRFQYHLGGYAAPFCALQQVELPVRSNSEVKIAVDALRFFNEVDIASLGHVMSPCAKAVSLAETAAKMFQVQP